MKKPILIFYLFLFFINNIKANTNTQYFVFEVNADLLTDPTTGNPLPFSLPVLWQGVTDYNFSVEWNNNGTWVQYEMINGVVTAGNSENIGTNSDSFYFFFNSPGLKTIRISGPNFPGLRFENTTSYWRSTFRRIIKWGNVTWQNMEGAFYKCQNLSIENDAGVPFIPNPISMKEMFRESSIDTNGNLGNWDVSNVTDMHGMFREAQNFDQDLGNWNPSNVVDMSFMFYKAEAFNNGNNPMTWGNGTVNVQDMRYMFAAGLPDDSVLSFNSAFNQDISSWNVSNVIRMDRMFVGASVFNNGNQPLLWNTQNVNTMTFMFFYATSFDQDLGSWNIGSLGSVPGQGSMEGMFEGGELSLTNFENTLTGWVNYIETNNAPQNVILHSGNSRYCDPGGYAISDLTDYGWSFEFNNNGGRETYSVCDATKFVMMWTVNANETINIPIVDTETYNYKVYWGDKSEDENMTISASHTYTDAGTYPIKIEGAFPRIDFSIPEALPYKNKIQSVENWGDIQWTSMQNAFSGCSNLTISETANIPDLSQVTNTSGMFNQCVSLDNDGNLSNWDVSTITNMRRMFRKAGNFNQDLSNWDVSNVTNMNAMFSEATNFNNNGVPLSWGNKTGNVTDFTQTFHKCWSFNQPLNDWDVSSAISMTSMFGNTHVFNQSLDNWDVSNVTTMDKMFTGAWDFNQNLSNWDVSNVTTTYWMFKEAYDYDNGGFPLQWGDNSQNITDMEGMFSLATSFNQPIIWNVSNVTNMRDLFWNADSFDQDISAWDVSSVTSMINMFFRADNYNNGGNALLWGNKTGSLTNTTSMFYENNFNQPIELDMSNVTSMNSMFFGNTVFNQDIDSWDVGNVTLMESVFHGATSFNQDISSWNVSNVLFFNNLFRNAISFDQDLGNWDVSSAMMMNNMFRDVTLSTSNYDSILFSWSQSTPSTVANFHGGNSQYCDQASRDAWEVKGWNITDGGEDGNCTLSTENLIVNEVKIYPNPFYQSATISFRHQLEDATINVYDLKGKLIKTESNIQGSSYKLKRDGLSSGIYFIQIKDKKSISKTLRIIVR